MKTADNLAEYLYYQIFNKLEWKYMLIRNLCKTPDNVLKKYRDNMAIIGEALLRMAEEGEYH